MFEASHWHPVALSREVGARPLRRLLNRHAIVLFRAGGRIGVLDDRCPHRATRLSGGHVHKGVLVCPYHGWRFEPDGAGHCPSQPGLKVSAGAWDVQERHGAVWVRRGGERAMPDLTQPGLYPLRPFAIETRAPLELVLDNLADMEHFAAVHQLFGLDVDALSAIRPAVEVTSDSVRVRMKASTGRIGGPLGLVVRRPPTDQALTATLRFSPVWCHLESRFLAPGTTRLLRRSVTCIFATPTGPDQTTVTVFPWVHQPTSGLLGGARATLHRSLLRWEADRDRQVVERIASDDIALRGYALGPLDKALGPVRRYLDRLYRGNDDLSSRRHTS